MSMASSSSSSSQSSNYDIFLSFRGEDTRTTFMDHLYTAFKDRLISVYRDDEALPRGESIRPALFKAIEEAEVAVVVFSKNYADSSWCLEELTHIIKCKDERNLIVIPIFYGVDPSDLRKQKGTFEEAFAKHETESKSKVELWRKALVDASEIAGFDPKNMANGHEAKAIREIVDSISDKLFPLESNVDEGLVSNVDEGLIGMSARLQELEKQLQIGSPGVRMVGIWGVGGGGKTTLATALCTNVSSQFDGYCIVENVRVRSFTHGLKTLQEAILSTFWKKDITLQSVDEGRIKIKAKLRRNNVLIVLDDVDHADQLRALAGSHDWFGSKSRIVITTRDEQLLIAHKVDMVCPVTLLTNEEAIQLFNKRAYNEKRPVKDYDNLSLKVVSYAAGLPIALNVLGCFLNGQDEEVWMDTLKRLKKTSEEEIVNTLKISYDGLQNDEKELFLDIACFFRHHSTKNNFNGGAMEILEACGYSLYKGIRVLEQKALISIKDDMFDMHDLIQDMAHHIVRSKHPNNPEKHSRVWAPQEIYDMYSGDGAMENETIEVIQYPNIGDFEHQILFNKVVPKMRNLRWLDVKQAFFQNGEGPVYLSNELRCIYWSSYSSSTFPDSFQPRKLVVLRLYRSLQKQLWKDCKPLPQLKVISLHYMKNLLTTPNFNDLPCLQKLSLVSCPELVEIHSSLGYHKRLEHVSVFECKKLAMLPTIVKMEMIKTIIIQRCHKHIKFPEIKSNMGRLEKLSLEGVGLDNLLLSIGERCANLIELEILKDCFYIECKEVNFNGLQHLEVFSIPKGLEYMEMPKGHGNSLRHWYGSQLSFFFRDVFPQMASCLQKLNLSLCWLRDGEIPSDVGKLYNLRELHLEQNKFTRLHFSLLQLTQLRYLNMSCCYELVELPRLPSGLVILEAKYCRSLTTIKDIHKSCKWLNRVSIRHWSPITDGGDDLLESMLKGKAFGKHYMYLELSGLMIARSFSPSLLRGGRYVLKFPENWCNDFCGILICAVVVPMYDSSYLRMEKHEMNVTGSEYGGVWEESDDGELTTEVWYVPFASLRETKWWDESSKEEVLLSLDKYATRAVGVRLVAKTSTRTGLTETLMAEEQSAVSPYCMPPLKVTHDSKDVLQLKLSPERYNS